MELSKQEIEEELARKREVIKALMRRRRPLELQAAKKGGDTPPDVLNEIADITDQIRAQEEGLDQLRTLAAIDKEPLADVEYRELLAEAWGTEQGHPTVVAAARLEVSRLRLGIRPERARELEHEIRVALAEEVFSGLDLRLVDMLNTPAHERGLDNIKKHYPVEVMLQRIGCAIRLDPPTALQMFLLSLPLDMQLDIETFGKSLRVVNKAWRFRPESPLFIKFLAELEEALTVRSELKSKESS